MIVERSFDYEESVRASGEAMHSYFEEHKMTWTYEDRLEIFRRCDLFKVKDNKDIGFFMVWVRKEKFFIADIQVKEAFRNQGYGGKILSEIRKLARARGYPCVWLRVFKSNPAIGLYERTGFQIMAEEKVSYVMSSPA